MSKRLSELEYVGWLFFGVTFLVALPVCIVPAWLFRDEDFGAFPAVSVGVFSALVLSGIITWAVNDVLHRRSKKKHQTERKRRKKGKK